MAACPTRFFLFLYFNQPACSLVASPASAAVGNEEQELHSYKCDGETSTQQRFQEPRPQPSPVLRAAGFEMAA